MEYRPQYAAPSPQSRVVFYCDHCNRTSTTLEKYRLADLSILSEPLALASQTVFLSTAFGMVGGWYGHQQRGGYWEGVEAASYGSVLGGAFMIARYVIYPNVCKGTNDNDDTAVSIWNQIGKMSLIAVSTTVGFRMAKIIFKKLHDFCE